MLKSYPTKPCRFCGSMLHFPYKCKLNPKGYKHLKRIGKYSKQWLKTRATWIRKHPPDENGHWVCYLQIHPWCPRLLTIDSLTLDHVESRTRSPGKRFKADNLRPACSYCNKMKGSRALSEVK